MSVVRSNIDTHSDAFRANAEAMEAAVAEIAAAATQVLEGGGEKARARHLSRGKLLPRERIDRLLDPGSPFLELSQLAAWAFTVARCRRRGSSPASAGSPAPSA